MKTLDSVSSPFEIYDLTNIDEIESQLLDECKLTDEQLTSMINTHFTKLVCPFGVIMAGTDMMPED